MKTNISQKTLQDLEFPMILDRISEFSNSHLGKEAILKIKPMADIELLQVELHQVNEYLGSFASENYIPNHEFEEITKEIHLLGVEGSFIESTSFISLATMSDAVNTLKLFFKKLNDIFPSLHQTIDVIEFTKEISLQITRIITPFGEVKDNASDVLLGLRKSLKLVKGKLSTSFNKSLAHNASAGYLDDIRESVVDNQRVLAVSAMYRKKVKGSILGSSKTGSIVFIAPESTMQFVRELRSLEYEEKDEIVKILKKLTNSIRPFKPLLQEYQEYLLTLDVIAAKAKYAKAIHGCLPKISKHKKVVLRDAYHPILWENNNEKNIKTIPQTLELNPKQQIIVISGPNAGGKSITLKTIGLLQVMLQSGILIPVHEKSETHIFSTILTDIGDNQSIENQLSTYSYRLKNMRNFLRKCNKNTLFLIDEFGTGSDPELGGALAEIFLEEFYQKSAYGIITTHYANLKVLANELDNVVNANMQFDTRTLEPLFNLQIGQAGSSFTFEVAQKNGIPFSLINRAKKKVEREKIRLDKTISKLQGERNKMQRTHQNLEKEQEKAKSVTEKLTEKQQKLQDKITGLQELYDSNQKMLQIGRKINEFSNRYFQNNDKKQLLSNFQKWITIEKVNYIKKLEESQIKKPKSPVKFVKKNKLSDIKTEQELLQFKVKNTEKPSKRDLRILKKKQQIVDKKQQEKLAKIEKGVLIEVGKVRRSKQENDRVVAQQKANYIFKVGDKVRLEDSRTTGTVEKIEKKWIYVNFGRLMSKTTTDKLMLV
ncbi:MAG: DNA mismatch repair protein MutS [Flavobacteriaceae bacterium]